MITKQDVKDLMLFFITLIFIVFAIQFIFYLMYNIDGEDLAQQGYIVTYPVSFIHDYIDDGNNCLVTMNDNTTESCRSVILNKTKATPLKWKDIGITTIDGNIVGR